MGTLGFSDFFGGCRNETLCLNGTVKKFIFQLSTSG